MPMPVSETVYIMVHVLSSCFSQDTVSETEPSLVYLMALLMTLISTCLILTSSPTSSAGMSGDTSTLKSSFLSFALIQSMPTISESMSPVRYGSIRSCMLPDWNLLMSRISLMRLRRRLPAALMLTASSMTSSLTSSLKIISLSPMMVLIGVLISWLMLEKNVVCDLFSI